MHLITQESYALVAAVYGPILRPLARYYVDPVCTSMPFSSPRRSGNSGISVPCLLKYRNSLFTSGALPYYQNGGRHEDSPVQAQGRLPLLQSLKNAMCKWWIDPSTTAKPRHRVTTTIGVFKCLFYKMVDQCVICRYRVMLSMQI